ncbi:G-alpha-domain-containing protein [Marasmius fiardii PR-910]|nr:G-alpha-domain-containing protein [Marasmius fiardii PR-910]
MSSTSIISQSHQDSSPDHWPPPPSPDLSEEQKEARLQAEREAKRVSDAIDLAISQDREARRSRRSSVGAKILLLGQAESGKSTILKNFQLHFSPKAFQEQSELWRPVIHLNLVRSVNFILNVLLPPKGPPSPASSRSTTSHQLDDKLRRLCFSLTPLKQVEETLTKRIVGSTTLPPIDTAVAYRSRASSSASSSTAAFVNPNFSKDQSTLTSLQYHPARASEISIRSGSQSSSWKRNLNLFSRLPGGRRNSSENRLEAEEDISNRRIISACSSDIQALWQHPDVQTRIKEEEIHLKDQPGFFLEDVPRITQENYIPSSHDILRARVRTIGPEEHRISMENTAPETGGGKEWVIYDVGGARSQRAAWAQFFDDVTVIIFLAPISAFNQALAEDRTVNRLADSMKLWRTICSNKLLASVDLILLLNKIDILDARLKAGVQFSKYVTSYSKEKPNTVESVSKYLLDMFSGLHQQNTPKKRKIHPHLTCAVDTKATSIVIHHIQELILLKTLSETNIL